MPQHMRYLKESPSQTAGPYVHIGLISHQAGFDIFENNFGNVLVSEKTQGERIRIEGHVYDGAGTPVRDALLEIWQANAFGRYNHPTDRQDKPLDQSFRGWGRTGAEFRTGLYFFEAIKPGSVAGRTGKGTMAPHINFWIAARGINIGLHTRMYFGDESDANANDPVLKLVEQESRRATLVAPSTMREGKAVYTFEIYLQGERETVFLDV
ncbi:MAG: protocatechuate 3,4-dioxygenase subunit alpha [Acetobacteraceae bacterium]|nr:protocatechuate 3,4-dioxygenase subunit alpha [Acetobacteraceae bacterium]